MGIKSWLTGGDGEGKADDGRRKKLVGTKAEYPSVEHTSAVSLIESMVRLVEESPQRDDVWLTFAADAGPGKEDLVVQVQGWTLNTCVEEVDIESVCEKAGLRAIAEQIKILDDCLYELTEGDAADMAKLVDAVYVHHFGLRPGYLLEGLVEK